jgi:CubicO group peptidase (beta-lactamase class C family)
MKPVLKTLFTVVVSLVVINQSFAQRIDSATVKKIDSLFKQWDKKGSPGNAVAIVRNDSVIYSKGYGMANLEHGIPITSKTIFEMGSVSKQFTAYAIFLLAKQGKLNLSDDIRKYLPWMPDFEKKITISNLLYHTSGIRDYDYLLNIAGTTPFDVITREHLIKVLSKQRALNFDPGQQYMYCNSGYFLLGEIVRAVTGKSLRKFTDSAVFKPLGMNNTHFHDDYTELVTNRAYPYTQPDKMGIVNSSVVGAKGLLTNTDDMSKWVINFLNSDSKDHPIIEQMKLSGKLNNGKETGIGSGLETMDFRGVKEYFHPGNHNGYYNLVTTIPEKKMAFIIFSNCGDHDIFGEVDQMAGLFIKDPQPQKTEKTVKLRGDSIITDTLSAKKLLGPYVVNDGDHAVFKLKNRKFYYANYGKDFLLLRTARDSFYFPLQPVGIKFAFKIKNAHDITVSQTWPEGYSRIMRKQDPFNDLTQKQLMAYTGRYYCPELDCSYHIILKEHKLVLTNAKYRDSPLTVYSKSRLLNDLDWMKSLDFTWDKKGKITGFEVNYDLVQDLRFEKVE